MFGTWNEKNKVIVVQVKDEGENHENLKNVVRLDGLSFMNTWLVVNISEIDKIYDEGDLEEEAKLIWEEEEKQKLKK